MKEVISKRNHYDVGQTKSTYYNNMQHSSTTTPLTQNKTHLNNSHDIDDEHNHHPKLWIIEHDNDNTSTYMTTNQPSKHMPSHIQPETEESFQWARSISRKSLMVDYETNRKYKRKCDPPSFLGQYRSLGTLVCNSFVIVQEFALSTLYLSSHRCLVCIISEIDVDFDHDVSNVHCKPCFDESKAMAAFYIFGITFPCIALWTITARRQKRKNYNDSGDRTKARHRAKLYYRTIDAIIIAAMLRFLSSVLRTLTASYSSDTINALSIGGMILHLLTCDYNFANGIQAQKQCTTCDPDPAIASSTMTSSSIDITYEKGRPLFLGGTISINSVFCSAALLASRCPTDSSSYLFLMATVVLFAYYPEARHVVAVAFGNHFVYFTIITTSAMCTSAYLLLNDGIERTLFQVIVACIIAIAPTLRCTLQHSKEIIGGPWEIAHVKSSDM